MYVYIYIYIYIYNVCVCVCFVCVLCNVFCGFIIFLIFFFLWGIVFSFSFFRTPSKMFLLTKSATFAHT